MSASTVAVTANPPLTATNNNNNNNTNSNSNTPVLALGARRRNVTVTEKRTSNIEMSNDMAALEQASSEKAKEIAKKALIGSRTRRKPTTTTTTTTATKPSDKGKLQTVMSVFLKNFVLLIVLLGLVQLIGRMFNSGYKTAVLPTNRVSEIEGRMNEIDSLLKKTTKMVQVQFDVVDKKIENEVGGVRRELMKQIEERGLALESGLRKLDARAEDLHKSLSELGSFKYLTEDDLERFRDELKTSRGSHTDEPVSLDEIKSIARDIVFKEIEKHAADGQGMVDYALASAGAFVVSHSESLYPTGTTTKWLAPPKASTYAQKMLLPSFGEPGQCFALKGSNGFVEIKLRTEIIPEAVTLEHVAKAVAYDRSSAPKDCKVTGWLRARDADKSALVEKVLLAEFTYDLEKHNVQTFNVDSTSGGLVNMVRFDFTSNHGAPHTCIYRFRVHGYEPDQAAVSRVNGYEPNQAAVSTVQP